jgi:hypothetical protein
LIFCNKSLVSICVAIKAAQSNPTDIPCGRLLAHSRCRFPLQQTKHIYHHPAFHYRMPQKCSLESLGRSNLSCWPHVGLDPFENGYNFLIYAMLRASLISPAAMTVLRYLTSPVAPSLLYPLGPRILIPLSYLELGSGS